MQLDELEVARQKQFAMRENDLGMQAKQERDEFMKIVQEQKISEDQDCQMNERRYTTFRKHAQDIRNQITNNDEIRKQDRQDYLEEGRQVRNKIEMERLKLEAIKQKKLAGIQHLGIHEKYQAELAKKKIH